MLLAVSTFLGCNHEESADKKSRAGNGATNKHDAKLIPGKEFSYDNLVWVGAGTYKMGSNTGQKDEQPVHTVKLNGFWIGKFEVTNAEFSEFTKATGYKTVAEAAPKAGRAGRCWVSPLPCRRNSREGCNWLRGAEWAGQKTDSIARFR